ncbi:MAG: polysaccharide pyruvyl transferase family protein [Candidatus Wildermuthbacteria bacterium]|nr:polysaccharide pyruvyl transferase family protein [Candidatus Wildermuthbacteria bacterium]
MYNIVLLKSPGSLNIGNEFINAGSEYALKKALETAGVGDYRLFTAEFWETGNLHHATGSSWNTKEVKSWLNRCDLIAVSAGSVNAFMREFLEDMGKFAAPTIILGAGLYQYTQEEKELAKEAFKKAKLVVCRDHAVYETLKDVTNAHDGLDMAFFIQNAYTPPLAKGDYAVLNIDMDFKRAIARLRKYRELKKKFKTVYVTEHNSTMYNQKDFAFLSRWTEFCNLYANASFVSTVRIHTSILCTLFHTPFEYLGTDCEPNAKRSMLFRQIGMSLERGKQYSIEELKSRDSIISQKKEDTIQAIASTVSALLTKK